LISIDNSSFGAKLYVGLIKSNSLSFTAFPPLIWYEFVPNTISVSSDVGHIYNGLYFVDFVFDVG